MISDLYAFPPESRSTDTLTGKLSWHTAGWRTQHVAPLLPNQDIPLNTLALQEAKDIGRETSPHDERSQELIFSFNNAAAKVLIILRRLSVFR